MTSTRVLPPEINANDLEQAAKLLAAAAQTPHPLLSTDPALLNSLYYPLRQVPLPSFQFEMLVWINDKLNVFSESSSLKFDAIQDTDLSQPTVKYKRTDPFSVVALAVSDNAAAVFTNEVSQNSWELIGVFNAKDIPHLLKENQNLLVDYADIETSFDHRQKSVQTKSTAAESAGKSAEQDDDGKDDEREEDDDDAYWDKYGQDSETGGFQQSRQQSKEAEVDEDAYWDKYTENVETIEAGNVRDFAVQALLDLAELYKDCGVEDLSVITEEFINLGLGRAPPSHVEVPSIARRHALRTLKWIKEGNAHYNEEIFTCIEKLRTTSS